MRHISKCSVTSQRMRYVSKWLVTSHRMRHFSKYSVTSCRMRHICKCSVTSHLYRVLTNAFEYQCRFHFSTGLFVCGWQFDVSEIDYFTHLIPRTIAIEIGLIILVPPIHRCYINNCILCPCLTMTNDSHVNLYRKSLWA